METNFFLDVCAFLAIVYGLIHGIGKVNSSSNNSYPTSNNFLDFLLGK